MSSPPVKAPYYVEVPAKTKETATVIFMHGSGGGWEDMEYIAKTVQKETGMDHIRWICPKAPVINFGPTSLPAWFNVTNRDLTKDHDEEGIMHSIASIEALLDQELARNVNEEHRIVLGGLSQGGAMSLLTGLTSKKKLAGLIVLSGRLPIQEKFKTMASEHAKSIPILWCHGTADDLVKYSLGVQCTDFLHQEIGFRLYRDCPEDYYDGITWKSYGGLGHWFNEEELMAMAAWLRVVLPQSGSPPSDDPELGKSLNDTEENLNTLDG
ncbi:Phospholipase/carboxylesterase [Flagelloscypha sp. PMI_526]|nr:Phospholipase/carboxylesterase [Flagelloscypha sp. PMI_526]